MWGFSVFKEGSELELQLIVIYNLNWPAFSGVSWLII